MTVALICLLVLCAVDTVWQMLYLLHMLQLTSYRNELFAAWGKEHEKEVLPARRLVGLVGLGVLLLCSVGRLLWAEVSPVVGVWIAVGLMAVTAATDFPRKAKKPLVVTGRIKRMMVTFGILALLVLGGVAALCWLTDFRLLGVGAVILLLWLLLIVAVIPLVNTLNHPIETAINNKFIREAKQILADHKTLKVIGITGSYGKTSTKYFLQSLLATQFNVLATPGSVNTPLGLVRVIRENMRASHEIFLAEMGAKWVGDIQELCDLVHPQYGIIASIGPAHLEMFGSMENIVSTKFELADALPADGFLCLNTDNEYIANHPPVENTRTVSYGVKADSTADYRATDLTVGVSGSTFTVIAPDGERCEYTTRLLGAHNIQNLVGCIAIAHQLGIPLTKLKYAVRLLKPVEHRLELLPNGFIDDAYNANPAGFRAALDVLAAFPGQRVLVTPGMVELGDKQDEYNEQCGAYAADKCDYAVLVGERQAPPLKRGLLSAGFPEDRLYVAANLQDGLNWVERLPREGQRTVLLENDLPDNFL